MTNRRITMEDLEGIPLVHFGDDLDILETAREFRDLVTAPSIESVIEALETQTLYLNMLLVARLERKERDPIIKFITEVNALTALKVMMEYEQAHRIVRVEASQEAVSRKGAASKEATWQAIDEFVKSKGRPPRAKELDALVTAKRKELGLKPESLSHHQVNRHFTAWRKAHPI